MRSLIESDVLFHHILSTYFKLKLYFHHKEKIVQHKFELEIILVQISWYFSLNPNVEGLIDLWN